MNRFVLKNTFMKICIYHFSINIFVEIKSQSCVLETVSLSKTTSFTSTEGVHSIISPHIFKMQTYINLLLNTLSLSLSLSHSLIFSFGLHQPEPFSPSSVVSWCPHAGTARSSPEKNI